MKKLIFIPFLFFIGCCGSSIPEVEMEVGSPFRPDTDLTKLSDLDLLDDYEFILTVVENQQEDVASLESGKAALSSRIAFNCHLAEFKGRLNKNEQARDRLSGEIRRRGLTPWPHKKLRWEPFLSFVLVFDRESGRSGRVW
jgi:hypothetical protein